LVNKYGPKDRTIKHVNLFCKNKLHQIAEIHIVTAISNTIRHNCVNSLKGW